MAATQTQPRRPEPRVIGPQPGPQEHFLSTRADIAIYGGSAGSGKSFAALMEALRHVQKTNFYAVYFRRTTPQITNPGGLWDTARKLYPAAGGHPRESPVHQWEWDSGSRVQMSHLQHPTSVEDWQGSQIPLIVFDELCHFEEGMFWYMLSRNRGECGVRPYMRATCNPDPDSWVARLLDWWIDPVTGYPIPERSGVLRYFVRVSDELVWGDSPADVLEKSPGSYPGDVKSLTFISAKLEDNKILEQADPGYRANLRAMSRVMQERLLGGNWHARASAGKVFAKNEAHIINTPPNDIVEVVRRWDLAATEPSEANRDPDWTTGVKMGRTKGGRYVVMHVEYARKRSHAVHQLVQSVADRDGHQVKIGLAQDPGQAGVDQVNGYVRDLAGYTVWVERETGDKITRADAFSTQWQAGNVDIVRGPWNDWYLSLMDAFPTEGVHDDPVDASSGAFQKLVKGRNIFDVVR